MRRVCRGLLLGVVALAQDAAAIGPAPAWETPEIIDGDTSTGTRGERMLGQDRWLDFDPYGLPGVAVPIASTEFGTRYLQRLPAAGWTTARLITGGGTHATFHYNEHGFPEVANIDFQARELLFTRYDADFLGFKTGVAVAESDEPDFDRQNTGLSIANDPLGRATLVYTVKRAFFARELRVLVDVNNDGRFNDDISPIAESVSSNNTRPSLAFDSLGRSYIGTIASGNLTETLAPVEVFVRNPPTVYGSTLPDPSVNSSFVSLAINPITDFPAVAYNDVAAKALKYAVWDGDTWIAETIDTQGFLTAGENMPVSLAYDPTDGRPAIAYTHDATIGQIGQPPPIDRLKFAWHDGDTWRTQMVDATAGVASGGVALAFNDAPGGYGDGLPSIAYIAGDDTVRYVRDPVRTTTPGDFDNDGAIDAADYTTWRDSAGAFDLPAYSPGDANGDGSVDASDYLLWRQNYAAAPTGVTTPEPAGAAIAAHCLFLILAKRRGTATPTREMPDRW